MRGLRKGQRMSHPFRILDPALADLAFAGRCALAVMAKAPIAGKVKTRLSPPLTSAQAAELNACFLRDTIANLALAADVAPAEVVISYTPVGEESAFAGVVPEATLFLAQRGVSFGERLLASAEDLFACGFSSVCLIDSDSPTVPTEEFVTAVQVLAQPGAGAVLGRSADGGYYLIGLQEPQPNLFERITWSTELVFAQTLERAREVQLPVTLLGEWYDVDDAESLDRLHAEMSRPLAGWPGYPAPHSRAYLLGLEQARTPRAETLVGGHSR